MVSLSITLSSINDVKSFVNLVNRYDFDVELVSGKYVIDAKSIMGIFSLDLSKKLLVQADCTPDNPIVDELEKYVAK